MLKVFVEEAAALASIVLFVGMIAVWAQLITQLWRQEGGSRRSRRSWRPHWPAGEKPDGAWQ